MGQEVPTTLGELGGKPKEPRAKHQGVLASTGAAPRYAGIYPIAIAQERYIEFCAANGSVVDEGGNFRKMSVEALAAELGVSRPTLYYWQKSIPNFWGKVRARLREVAGGNRTAAVWDSVWLTARAGKVEAQKLWLTNHDPDYISPTEKLEHDFGPGMAGLLAAARNTKRTEEQNQPEEGQIANG